MENRTTEIEDFPKGNWTKLTKGFPKHFSAEDISRHEEKSGAKKHLKAGYRMFASKKVKNVLLSHSVGASFSKAKVEASFRRLEYNVRVKVLDSGKVDGGECNCKAGKGGVCKHVCALLWFLFDVVGQGLKFIPDAIACTEKAREWASGSKKTVARVKFSDLVFVKHSPINHSTTKVPKDKIVRDVKLFEAECRRVHLGMTTHNMLTFMCQMMEENDFQEVSEPKPCELPAMELHATATQRVKLPLQILWEEQSPLSKRVEVALTLDEAHDLEKMTRLQSAESLWHEERKKRVTASKFGEIVTRKAAFGDDFVAAVFNGRSITTKYMEEGTANESAAIKKFCAARKEITFFPVGFVVNPGVPFLGASPDGLLFDAAVEEFGLLEIKTLAKAKELGLSVSEAVSAKKAPFLSQKMHKLSKNHKYFYQIQGQMAVTGLLWCDFLVDSGTDQLVERIVFDEVLWRNGMLPKLASFYSKYR